ncbi:hypothetical protein [Nocardia brasiliensis]|uniref:hypothetical protein n=1 Tax=Nocardia brasiliensis TaxID=37326 RepID=UPI00114CE6A3|nr:hypothetical protein [Nocardia brasiliensis]
MFGADVHEHGEEGTQGEHRTHEQIHPRRSARRVTDHLADFLNLEEITEYFDTLYMNNADKLKVFALPASTALSTGCPQITAIDLLKAQVVGVRRLKALGGAPAPAGRHPRPGYCGADDTIRDLPEVLPGDRYTARRVRPRLAWGSWGLDCSGRVGARAYSRHVGRSRRPASQAVNWAWAWF